MALSFCIGCAALLTLRTSLASRLATDFDADRLQVLDVARCCSRVLGTARWATWFSFGRWVCLWAHLCYGLGRPTLGKVDRF